MKNAWKKLSVAAILAAMLLTMAACGSDAPSSAASDASASTSVSESASEAAPEAAPAEVTEESYKAEVKRIYDAITEKSAAMGSIDATDPVAAAEAMKVVAADVSPLYTEMAGLTAPESMKDLQATISDGAAASAELLGLSIQLMDVAAGTAEGDATALQAEVQTKIAELTPKATAFGEALQKVLA